MDFAETLKPLHWDRFERYRRRIKSLRVVSRPPALSPGSTLELLSTAPRGEAIFPSLTALCWTHLDYDNRQLAIALFHPKLERASLSLMDPEMQSGFVIEHLIRISPHLQSLSYWNATGAESTLQARASVLRAFASLQSVRSVELDTTLLTPELVQTLAHKPHLQRLWASRFAPKLPSLYSSEDMDIASSSAFPALSELSVESVALLRIPGILVAGARLISLYIEVLSMDSIRALSTLVSTRCTNLRYLCMLSNLAPDQSTPFSMDMVRPLLRLRKVETLVIESLVPPLLSDRDIEELVAGFPELRHLEICPRAVTEPQQPCPTLAGVTSIARHCRKLISFGIYVDASNPPAKPLRSDIYVFSLSLETMHVLCSRIYEPYLVADFLLPIMPARAALVFRRYSEHLQAFGDVLGTLSRSVDSEEGLNGNMKLYRNRWTETSKLLRYLKHTRETIVAQRTENAKLMRQLESGDHQSSPTI
ncbi:hypothetical protein SISSUDRAFT_1046222 [Sistotremastrum suecicum HHB10207 ss-3]|uniref:F-box domain-containing protein n=1 Tax=Sistotremastrum suecicum HHB10207 ss-3 TaxID=1314776 RepID=A0A166DYB8_9AGAM|nr:hypothetical protein SISSUDRAFT_1046222 [Sistotremastrum suecicum HHB10207 ss-3]